MRSFVALMGGRAEKSIGLVNVASVIRFFFFFCLCPGKITQSNRGGFERRGVLEKAYI